MKRKIKWVTVGLVVLVGTAYLSLSIMGANALEKSPVHPDDLAKVSECELRVLQTEKGRITYNALFEAAEKCENIERIDLEFKQMIVQKEFIKERLASLKEKSEKEKESDKKDVEK